MKKLAYAGIFISLVLTFTSCSWQMPEKISVKSNADYNFALGTFEKDLGNSMDLTSMMGDTGKDNEDIETFDYWPGKEDKNTQHFLLKVKLSEIDLAASLQGLMTAINTLPIADDAEIDFETDLSSLASSFSLPADTTSLDFNPSAMLSSMKKGLGSDMAEKISFPSVPMYLYCAAPGSISTTATFRMFYGDKDTKVPRPGTTIDILNGTALTNTPVPTLQKETVTVTVKENDKDVEKSHDVVITDLRKSNFIGPKDAAGKVTPVNIASIMNDKSDAIQDGDLLYVEYALTGLSGKVTKADAQDGLKITLYAVIDLPILFKVTDDLDLDLSSMTKKDDNNSSSTSTGTENTSNSSSDKDKKEFEKYLQIVDSITLRYTAYNLPIYSRNEIKLMVDFLGTGDKKDYVTAPIEINQQKEVTLLTSTIQKLREKDVSSFKPNILIHIAKDSEFSIPRDKAVKMNIQLNLKTDGTVQITE